MVETEQINTAPAPRPAPDDLDARIMETTIELADEVGWGSVRLREVAARLGISMAELQSRHRDQDSIADAWFARAWQAMLAPPPEGFAAMPAQERLQLVMMRWFDALAPHRRVSCEMIEGKLHLPHAHHWVPMIFNLSRTIQWLRDAALLDAGGRRREVEEVGLTALFLATLAVWRRDETPNQERTREFLSRRLGQADGVMVRIWGAALPPAATGDAA